MTEKRNCTYTITAVIIAIILITSFIVSSGALTARAAASAYSDVMQDLKKDESFNADKYPVNDKDYSLKVIQIAESTAGELLIYVYQPAGDKSIKASSINIARELDGSKDLSFKNYRLSFQNSNGVFFKYKVNGFELATDTVRYYNISNIMRPYNSEMDKPPASGQTVSEASNRVAQQWTVETVANNVTYTMTTSEVIEITQKVVGYCVYNDGTTLDWGTMEGITKAYFIAFDTDRPIDKLISAELSFFATRVKCKYCANDKHTHGMFYDFEDGEYIDFGTGVYNDEPLTITDKQNFGNQNDVGNIRPATKYLFKRIRKLEEFKTDNNNKDYKLTAGGEAQLSGTKWVLNFYEAHDKYKLNNVWLSFIPGVTLIKGVADGEAELNNVYDVSILRLEFETNGKPYNLGVVDNKQTGNTQFNKPIEQGGCAGCGSCTWINALPWWGWVLVVIFSPVIILLLYKLVKGVVTGLIKFVCKQPKPVRLQKSKTGKATKRKKREDKRK